MQAFYLHRTKKQGWQWAVTGVDAVDVAAGDADGIAGDGTGGRAGGSAGAERALATVLTRPR